MMKKLAKGVELLAEEPGTGPVAGKGDHILYNVRIFLNHGDEVPINETQAARIPAEYTRTVDGQVFVDHRSRLGARQSPAGFEVALTGMQVGGYRRVKIAPHLAYRDKGVPGLVPENALLIVDLYLRELTPAGAGKQHGV